MDFIWEGLRNLVREKVGKCSSTKELWDKLHDIYFSPITDSKNIKEDADTNQEELCSPCQVDSEDEEYIITRGMLFCFCDIPKNKICLKFKIAGNLFRF
jgi:hypothetical protein